MPQFTDFQSQRDCVLQDAAAKLAVGDRDRFLLQAILQRYSKDRPRELVTDVAADGTSDLALPDAGGGVAFEDGFSTIHGLEYPVGNVPADELQQEDWQMYRTPSALKIRLLATTPASGENVRVTWTVRHKDDASTIPAADLEAVCDYTAALCFQALAAIYAQTGDPTMGADAVNYRSKSQEYMSLAKAARKRYFDHLGIQEEPEGSGTGPALSIGIADVEDVGGLNIGRMTHEQ